MELSHGNVACVAWLFERFFNQSDERRSYEEQLSLSQAPPRFLNWPAQIAKNRQATKADGNGSQVSYPAFQFHHKKLSVRARVIMHLPRTWAYQKQMQVKF